MLSLSKHLPKHLLQPIMASFVYIVQCADNSYYVGSTNNIEQRLEEHNSGKYQGYTSKRLPVKMLWFQEFTTILEAAVSERQIKGWSRAKKEALIRGDFNSLIELSKSKKATSTLRQAQGEEVINSHAEPVEASTLRQAQGEEVINPHAEPVEASARQQKKIFDIIIVGAGTAGIPCAIEAAKAGLERILVIEKANVIGGTLHWTVAHLSGGGSNSQKARGIEDSPEEHFADVMRISHTTADPVLTRLATEEAPKTLDWLESLGFPFDKNSPAILHGHVPYTKARTHFANVTRGGIVFLSLLLPIWDEYVQKGVITPLLGHSLTELCTENGNVIGVKAENGGKVYEYYAPKVILTTGGYAANAEFFKKVTPNAPPLFSTANPTSQGEGITSATRIGARFHNAEKHNVSLGGIETAPNSQRVDFWDAWAVVFSSAYRKTREIYLNDDGKRFMNEDEPSADVRERAVMAQANWRFWVVFDERSLRKSHEANEPLVRQWLTRESVRNHAARGTYLRTAQTLGELAQKCEIDVGNCENAVHLFNAGVHGTPDEFGRTTFLAPIQEAPFYALRVNASSLISFGGLAVNSDLQVLNAEGAPIHGLYAAGEILGAAATSGNAFCGGMLITPAISFGRILGKSMKDKV
jgi:fumarate reductase flavoprotein subunit